MEQENHFPIKLSRKEDVSAPIINEISASYDIDWSTFGQPITKDVRSKKLVHIDTSESFNEKRMVVDPITFTKRELMCQCNVKYYMVRGIFDEDQRWVQIYEIIQYIASAPLLDEGMPNED